MKIKTLILISLLITLSFVSCFSVAHHFNKTSNSLIVALQVIDDSLIKVTVTNISDSTIEAYSYVKTHENHYDYFELEALSPDNDRFCLSFSDDRDKSAPIIETLKPGSSLTHTINLKSWAERWFNKSVLKKAGFNYLPHGIKIRMKYFKGECSNCNEYYKSIWSGVIYSDWVEY